MAETAITVTSPPSQWSATGSALTMTALDNANGNKFLASRSQHIIVQNTSGGALTFAMTSQADSRTGRTGSVSQSLAAAELRIFRITDDGWAYTDGYVYLPSGQSASLKVCIINAG